MGYRLVITFKGTYFDGTNSTAHEVTASVQGNLLSIRGESVHVDLEIDKCTIEPALGSTLRTLHTPGGGRLDTRDSRAFKTLESEKIGTLGFRLIHLLESKWKAALDGVTDCNWPGCILANVSQSRWVRFPPGH